MTAFSITRFQAELADVDHVGNGIDDWRFGDSGACSRWIATTYRELFEQVFADPVSKTIAWPNGADIDPDVLVGGERPAAAHPGAD